MLISILRFPLDYLFFSIIHPELFKPAGRNVISHTPALSIVISQLFYLQTATSWKSLQYCWEYIQVIVNVPGGFVSYLCVDTNVKLCAIYSRNDGKIRISFGMFVDGLIDLCISLQAFFETCFS